MNGHEIMRSPATTIKNSGAMIGQRMNVIILSHIGAGCVVFITVLYFGFN
jgi:hypothetical protein